MEEKQIFKDVYALISELWCSPPEEEANRKEFKKNVKDVIKRLERIPNVPFILAAILLTSPKPVPMQPFPTETAT